MNITERNELIEDNLNLVYFMIEKHFATYIDRDELIGIGYEGIIKAADKFDKSKNIKFCTFACKCIHNEITKYLNALNYHCRKANMVACSIDNKIEDCIGEDLTFKEVFNINEDYSIVVGEEILNRANSLVANGRFILEKRIAGYTFREIGQMLNITGQAVMKRLSIIRQYLNLKEADNENIN